MVIGFGRRAMESSRKPHGLLHPVRDRRMPLKLQGSQIPFKRPHEKEYFIPLAQVPLQGVSLRVANLFSEADGCAETKYLQFTDDCKADIETIRKRNSVLERKVNDLTRQVNDLLSRNSKHEKDNKAEIEMMLRKNFGSEIKQCEKDNKAERERMQRKNANLEAEIKNLKRKIAALDVTSANNRGMELSATCLTSQLILSEPKDVISPMEMEYQEGSNSSDELAAGMIILIFLISFLIGMQIPTFT